MRRIFLFVMLFDFTALAWRCDKGSSINESILYGTWIKGTNAGDTLRFFQKNDKNIMTYNLSFNAALPALTEVEYSYDDGKLSVKNYLAIPGDFFPIQSFVWKRLGEEFEIQGSELFSSMAATFVHFTYHKIY